MQLFSPTEDRLREFYLIGVTIKDQKLRHGDKEKGKRRINGWNDEMQANSKLPCPHFSAGERKPEYPGPGYNHESAVRIKTHLFFVFSVTQCLCGAKVLSLVAASNPRPTPAHPMQTRYNQYWSSKTTDL